MKNRILGCVTAFAAGLTCMAGSSIFASAESSPSPYVVTVYNEKNGLPTGEANTVLQTSDGYIWIGSYGGLVRYDGSQFRNYSVEGKISSSSIRSLFEDSIGRLWIGTNDAGVVVMQDDVFTEIKNPEDNSFLCIRDFTEDDNGNIYVASNSGLAEISGGEIFPYDIPELSGNTVYSIAEDGRGRIWGSTNNGDCVVVSGGELVDIFTPERVFENTDIYSVEADKNGNIILGSGGNQLVRLSFSSDSLTDGYTAEHFNTGEVNTHNKISAYGEGYIFISGINGLGIISPDGSLRTFGEKENAASVNEAIADYENNIWFASSAYGLIKYSQACFDSPNDEAMLGDVTVNAIASSESMHFIGHNTGLIICDGNWHRVENELTEAFDGIRIRCIISDRNGDIWIASYSDKPVVRYNPKNNEITEYNEENGLAGEKARVVYELSDGRIAVGTQTGVSVIRDGAVIASYTHEDGLENPSVLCFAEGSEGEILAGTDGIGIYEISADGVRNFGFDSGLEEGVVLRMLRNEAEMGLFISAGSSLYYYRDGNFKKLQNFKKGAGSIFDFYIKDEKLYMLQNNGIIAADVNNLISGEYTETVEYGFGLGLSGSINANTWHEYCDNGKLFVATRNGVSIFGFEGIKNKLPKITVNSVNLDGKVTEHPNRVIAESGSKRITIDYSALSFTDTGEIRVAYQLVGFDRDEIISEDKSGSVSYTNLSGGSYTFILRAFNTENPHDYAEYTIEVIKHKAITEQPLFWIIITAVIILITVGIVSVSTRTKIDRIRRRQQEYRSIIEQSLLTFAKTIDAKDPYTNGHSVRVAKYSRELSKRMGMSEEEQENIYYMALLHDIGKIGIPDHILNKPGKLTEEERLIIQQHVDIGGDILRDFTALKGIANGAKFHHERYDGNGYSTGLKGDEIPKVARIIAVADTYDAMASDRCYRKALSVDVIKREFTEHSGAQFDPEIVPHIMAMIEEGTVPMDIE